MEPSPPAAAAAAAAAICNLQHELCNLRSTKLGGGTQAPGPAHLPPFSGREWLDGWLRLAVNWPADTSVKRRAWLRVEGGVRM